MKLDTRRPAQIAFAALFVAVTVVAWTGCDGSRRPNARRASAGRAAQQGANALLRSIRDQLRTLPESSQLELTPPTVVLDARTSRDGEDIEGILQQRPEDPSGPANLVMVPRGNAGFRGKVEPGDILKYYGAPDRETRERLRETGDVDIVTFESIDMIVAQVLSDDAVLIQGGFPQGDSAPRRIEVWRIVDDRMDEIQEQWGAYVKRRDPPLAWHPSPDQAALEQLTERLNQWLRQSGLAGKKADPAAWRRPELMATLPETVASQESLEPFLSDSELATGYFTEYESRLIQGAGWRRDIARWARGAASEPLPIAAALFDWTARNIQLVDDGPPPRWPWEMLLHGAATAEGRAWVFAGLCEQQNVTAAVLSVPTESGVRTLVGVLDGAELRVFDPALGLPIAGAEAGTIATLAELAADDSLLRALDLPEAAYPLKSADLSAVTAQVVASPFSLTRRAEAFAAKLTAEDALVLAANVDQTAERLSQAAGVEKVSLWPTPFETLAAKFAAKPSDRRAAVRDFLPYAWRPPLWRGRAQHFRGLRDDAEAKRDTLADPVNDHRAARRFYMNRNVRPTDKRLAGVQAEKREIYRLAKVNATLFLGTLSYDEGAYEVAKGWLENSALTGPSAEEHQAIVRYNLAHAYEKLGEIDRAVELLEAIEGPMSHGAGLLARQWRNRPADPADGPTDGPDAAEPDADGADADGAPAE